MKKLYTLIIALTYCFIQVPETYSQTSIVVSLSGKETLSELKPELVKKIESNTSEFLFSISKAFEKNSKPKFSSSVLTSEAMVTVLTMWEMSRFNCTATKIEERLLKKPSGGYEIRNIPITMAEAPEADKDQEIVLIFNDKGQIDNLYLSIETGRYNQLLSQGNDVTEYRRRQVILDFVENFRTAYNRKDISYISSVYSEDALIITGKVVQSARPDASSDLLPKQTVQYQKQSKKEYVEKLKKTFAANSYINVKFDELEIKQHKKYPSVYGVNMLQGWNTSNYSDVGYLLLVIDFANEDKPLIHVRTWQPEKVGGQKLDENEKFEVDQFNVAPKSK